LVPTEEDDAIDFTPMMTVVFLLLFFFMLISAFLDEAAGYRVALPDAEAKQFIWRDDADSATLTENEEIWYRDAAGEAKLKSLQELENKLKERADPNRPVILRCDRHCTYEQFTHLKNAVLNGGARTIFEEMGVHQ
jgi:biopolymer transport protein ExbD